jgi:hypothetical protein
MLRTAGKLLTAGAAALAALSVATSLAPSAGAQASPCAGRTATCADVGAFAAAVTDFRTSSMPGGGRIVTITVRFQNGASRPLRLGYVSNSGLVVDDQGNRFATYGAVRGIGMAADHAVDAKFALQPGESSDARFEFFWRPRSNQELAGTTFNVDLAVREIDAFAGEQYRAGREHALSFRGLGSAAAAVGPAGPAAVRAVASAPSAEPAAIPTPAGAAPAESQPAAAAPPRKRGLAAMLGAVATAVEAGRSAREVVGTATGAATGAANAATTAVSEATSDVTSSVTGAAGAVTGGCAAAAHCYDAGPFTADVVQLTDSRLVNNTGDHVLRLSVRFRNTSAQPIVLAYSSGTSIATDELGNRYVWGRAGSRDASVTGMGISAAGRADPQFALAPGEARTAIFQVRRFATGRNPIGTRFTYDLAIEQLEVHAGGQARGVRQHSISIPGLATGAR